MNAEGEPQASDLSGKERARAVLPATSALLGILALFGLAFVLYVNNQQDSDQKQREKLARQVERQRESDRRKFEVALAFAVNSQACGFKALAKQSIATLNSQIRRAHAAVVDPRSGAALIARNRKAEHDARLARKRARNFADQVIVTVPADYDCSKLPKQPPGGSADGS